MQIEWATEPSRALVCPICGDQRPKPHVLRVHSTGNANERLDLFLCLTCDSKFFPDLQAPAYGDASYANTFLKFYVETGAGIDQLIRHLFAVTLPADAQYLEVGCGFGFALDFAKQAMRLQVLGIDPSLFAIEGAATLDIPIINDYLSDETDLGDRRFDLVVGSEVIEHIFEPRAFLSSLTRTLAENGVLILTTPNAASAVPETTPGNLIPLLSAGWHRILYSQESLRRLLTEAGFRRVEIELREHTIIAAATNGNRTIDLTAEVDRNQYREYLNARCAAAEEGSIVRQGLAYRLFKELTNASRYQQALELYGQLHKELRQQYAIDLDQDDLPHCIQSLSFEHFASRYPMCLCGVTYARGIIALNHDAAPDRAVHYFSLSIRYGETLRGYLATVGADDAETELLVARAQILRLRALSYTAPDQAALEIQSLLRGLIDRVESFKGEVEEAIELFVHLVNLGFLEAADALTSEVNAARIRGCESRRVESNPLTYQVELALGRLAINRAQQPRLAALHFARAERAAKRWLGADAGAHVVRCLWQARHDRLLAWVVAGNARRATMAGRIFLRPDARGEVQSDVMESGRRLLAQAAESFSV